MTLKSKYVPGMTVQVTPRGSYQMSIDRPTVWHVPEPFWAKVLVVIEDEPDSLGGLVCEGRTPVSAHAIRIQDACREAGLDPEQRVQWVCRIDLPDDLRSNPGISQCP